MTYEVKGSERYEGVQVCDDSDYGSLDSFDGTPRVHNWKAVKVSLITVDMGKSYKQADFPWLGGYALVMRKKAVEGLRSIWNACGEILPLLETEKGILLQAFNSQVVDALDEAKSTIWRIPDTDRINRLKTVTLIGDRIAGFDVFRLPYKVSSTYVSERFKQQYEALRLTGLDFKPVEES